MLKSLQAYIENNKSPTGQRKLKMNTTNTNTNTNTTNTNTNTATAMDSAPHSPMVDVLAAMNARPVVQDIAATPVAEDIAATPVAEDIAHVETTEAPKEKKEYAVAPEAHPCSLSEDDLRSAISTSFAGRINMSNQGAMSSFLKGKSGISQKSISTAAHAANVTVVTVLVNNDELTDEVAAYFRAHTDRGLESISNVTAVMDAAKAAEREAKAAEKEAAKAAKAAEREAKKAASNEAEAARKLAEATTPQPVVDTEEVSVTVDLDALVAE